MSEISTPAKTASSESNKRELTSPFDPNDAKKSRSLSVSSNTTENSEIDTSNSRVRICDEDLDRIVDRITDGVVNELRNEIKELRSENTTLKEKVQSLEERLERVEDSLDQANQYSRRNCSRLSGIKETTGEDTDKIILEVANAVNANITIDDIDRSHRLGPPRSPDGTNAGRTKPRDIIIKFSSYRSRAKLYTRKSKLRASAFKGWFINEDLTRPRSELFYQCRLLSRKKCIDSAWTSDGVILVKDNRSKVHRVQTKCQLADLKVKLNISA